MRTYGKKLTALLLAVVMLLGLVACGSNKNNGQGGGKDKNDPEQLTGTIYLPEFMDLNLPNVEYVQSGCSDGKYIYIIAEIREEMPAQEGAEGEAVPDMPTPRDGIAIDTPSIDVPAMPEGPIYTWRTALFRMSMDGQEVTELENFKTSEIPEGKEGSVNISGLRPGADGTFWVTEDMYTYSFDLPADFNEETDDRWNYYTDGGNSVIWRQIDSTGNELARVDGTGLQKKLELDWMGSTLLDGSGNIYVSTDQKIFVLDKDQNILFELPLENWGTMYAMGDGSVGVLVYPPYVEGQDTKGPSLKIIDVAAKDWGTEYPMANSANNIYPGSEKYLFYYDQGDSLFGYNGDTQEGEKILSWISADINKDNLLFFTFLPDGRVAAMTRQWGMEKQTFELAILTETDASVLADKTILTYATMYLGYDTRIKVLEFNKTNPKYRIEIRDYSEFNTNGDYQAGLKKLNTEIGAGQLPDLLDTNGLRVQQYGAKGILEDLWPFIENDPELGRDKLMVRPLEAVSQDGKLYQIFSSFSIQSVMGATRVVGDRMSWTLADLQAALATMPEGCTIFGQGDTKDQMLTTVLSQNLDAFVDWTTGQCSFDTPEFISLLEFANSFPMEFDWDSVDWETMPSQDTLLKEGKQMLSRAYVYDLQDFQRNRILFGGDFSFIGYPKEDGSVGSTFSTNGGIAMTTKCKDKDGAWSFMRDMLLPVGEEGQRFYYGDFPINKADFDAKMEEAMKKDYQYDENGEIMKDENGEPIEAPKYSMWVEGGDPVDVFAATQADYDQFMALYNAVESTYSYDEEIYKIVTEEAAAYFNGDKTVEEIAGLIQSRVNLYVNEQR